MIDPQNNKISGIFGPGGSRLVVPAYQRKYEWGLTQVQELMNDLQESMESGKNLFLGNFIFDTHVKNESRIVDGQQRLTTLSLVLVAIREVAKQRGEVKLTSSIQSNLTFIDDLGDDQGAKLYVSPAIKDIYNYMIRFDREGDFPDRLGDKAIKRQSNKIKSIYNYIHDTIEEFDIEGLKALVMALKNSYVIVLNFVEQDDVYDIFERTNARGLDLNIDDLLKNYIFAQSDGNEDYEDKWNDIVENASGTLPRLLKYFWVSRKGYSQKKDLYRNIKGYGIEITIKSLVEQLLEFSQYYKAINSNDKNEVYDRLEMFGLIEISTNESYRDEVMRVFQALNLFNVKQVIPLIFSLLNTYQKGNGITYKQLIQVLKALEKYHFSNNIIANRVGNDVEKLYAKWALTFYESDNLTKDIEEFINILRSKRASESEFVGLFSELSYDIGPSQLAYIFDRFNNYNLKGKQIIDIYYPDPKLIKRDLNIEHLLAQKQKNNDLMSSEDKDFIDNIGNLLVLSRHTNSTLGSKQISEKIEILKQAEHSGRFGYIRDFLEEYKEELTHRGYQEIQKRANDLALRAYKEIWYF